MLGKRKQRQESLFVPVRRGKAISINTHDMDAELLRRPGKKTDFFHKAHFEFDAGSNGKRRYATARGKCLAARSIR